MSVLSIGRPRGSSLGEIGKLRGAVWTTGGRAFP
jgi:hypothetical protein